MHKISTGILIIVTLFYGYGGLVHVLNMLSLTGFDWPEAPLKWQALDVFYLAVDALVCAGLWRRYRPSIYAFYVAAVSQVVLYTVFRSWIIDVPEEFAVAPEQEAYLSLLVAFHVVSFVLVTIALRFPGSRPTDEPATT